MSKMANQTDKTDSGLRTVQRALDILFCFSVEEQELNLTEIANRINLAKSTTTRLLATLEQNNLIYKNPDTLKYKLGHALFYLGHVAKKSIGIVEFAKPIMQRIRDETRETVNLYVLEGTYRVCIEQYEGLQSVKHLVRIGEQLPLWAGAGGKVLLAYQPASFQEQIFQSVPSPERLESLRLELPEIRKEQCAASIDEREVGSAAVAAPIFNLDQEVRACLSISGPSSRFTPEAIRAFKNIAREGAREISRYLGHGNGN